MPYPKDIDKLKKKLDLYNGIVKSNASNTFALKKRMEVRFLLGDNEGAMEDFTQLILLDPENQNLKNHPFNPHRPDAEPIDPTYAEFFFTLGLLKMKKKKYEEALDAYEKTILIGEGKDDLLSLAYSDASFCTLKTKEWTKGYRYCSHALSYKSIQKNKQLKANLEYIQALLLIIDINETNEVLTPNTSRYQLVDKSVQVMLEFTKDDTIRKEDLADNFSMVAIAYKQLGKNELALEAINKTLSLQEIPEAYFFRAVLLFTMGINDEQAYQDLRTAFRLKPDLITNLFPDLNIDKDLTDDQKKQLMQSNTPMQPTMQILDDDIDLGGGR